MNQHILIAIQFQVSLIVAKNIHAALFRDVRIREIVKIEAFFP